MCTVSFLTGLLSLVTKCASWNEITMSDSLPHWIILKLRMYVSIGIKNPDIQGESKKLCTFLNSQAADSVHSTVSSRVLVLSLFNWLSNLKIWNRSVEKCGGYSSLCKMIDFFLCPMGFTQLVWWFGVMCTIILCSSISFRIHWRDIWQDNQILSLNTSLHVHVSTIL